MDSHRFVRIALGLATVLLFGQGSVMLASANEDDGGPPPVTRSFVQPKLGLEWTRIGSDDDGGIIRPLGVEWTRS
jgi:hypothetical protein